MPVALLVLGGLLIVIGFRGQQATAAEILRKDFLSSDNFVMWIVALLFIGAIGAYKPIRPISDGFLALVLVVLILSQHGFVNSFMEQVKR